MLSVKDLSVTYESKSVLENFSFESKGHLSILGANGSGKSTLAKALCALIGFKGEIGLNGKNILDLDLLERAKMIAYIPASLENFDPYVSLKEFVLMGRYLYKKPYLNYAQEDYKKVDEVLNRLGIFELSDHLLSALSSGQKQLCLIASALVQESEIIIFDEPTANLDPTHSVEISKIIRSLQNEHQTVLITHDLNFAKSIQGEVLFIKADGYRYYNNPDDFFTIENLEACYKTSFELRSLGMRYD